MKNAGALQPFGVRQLASPRPYFAPTMNPPFSIDGTTATHSALLRISWGMPESGADSISFSTSEAACTRSEAFEPFASSSAAKAKLQKHTIRVSKTSLFIVPHHTKIDWDSGNWIVNEAWQVAPLAAELPVCESGLHLFSFSCYSPPPVVTESGPAIATPPSSVRIEPALTRLAIRRAISCCIPALHTSRNFPAF